MSDKKGGGFLGGLGRMFRGGVEKSKRLGRLGLLKLDQQKAIGKRDTIHQRIGSLTVKRVRDSAEKTLDPADPALKHLLADLAEAEEELDSIVQQIEQISSQ